MKKYFEHNIDALSASNCLCDLFSNNSRISFRSEILARPSKFRPYALIFSDNDFTFVDIYCLNSAGFLQVTSFRFGSVYQFYYTELFLTTFRYFSR